MTDDISGINRPQLRTWTLGDCWIRLQSIFDFLFDEEPDSPQNRIVAFLSTFPLTDDDISIVLDQIVESFCLSGGEEELQEFFSIRNHVESGKKQDRLNELTFAELTEFIHQRTPRFQAVTVAGYEFGPAGVFLSFRPIVNHIFRRERRFAPSTPIRDILPRRQLRRFWQRLQYWTDGELQSLPRNWYTAFTNLWIALIGIPVLLLTQNVSPYWLLGLLVMEWITRAWLVEKLDRTLNPLPASIQTFRDLAEYLQPAV